METNTTPNPIPMQRSSHSRMLYAFITLLLFLLVLSVGWNIYSFLKKKDVPDLPVPQSSASDLFEIQNALVTGEITEVNGTTITITTQIGKKGSLPLAENVTISDLNEFSATPSSDVKSIKKNKTANINAQVINGEYQVTSINYIQEMVDLNSLPPRTPAPLETPVSTASAIVQ